MIEELKAVERVKESLRCPQCGGIQSEEKNCGRGRYRQWRCCSCGYVEQDSDKLRRATLIRFREKSIKGG